MKQRTLGFFIIILLIYSSTLFFVFPFLNVNDKTYIFTSRITYINRGQMIENLDSDLLTTNIFMNTSWQKAYLESVDGEYTWSNDLDENPIMVFNLSSLPPGGNVTVSYSVRLEKEVRVPPEISFKSGGNLDNIPEKFKVEYVMSEGTWVANENLTSLANNILASQGNTTNVLRIVSSVANWIGNNVKSLSHDIPLYAYETYESLEGDCDDQANLLIALCRILGIPAYLQAGALRGSSGTETGWNGRLISELKDVSYHAWAVVYVPPWGWLPFDMTLAWSSWDDLSVVKSAKIWDLDTMPLLNITKSDWAGVGRAIKAKVITNDVYIEYVDFLAAQEYENFQRLLGKWQFWSVVGALLGISIVLWRSISHLPNKLFRG